LYGNEIVVLFVRLVMSTEEGIWFEIILVELV